MSLCLQSKEASNTCHLTSLLLLKVWWKSNLSAVSLYLWGVSWLNSEPLLQLSIYQHFDSTRSQMSCLQQLCSLLPFNPRHWCSLGQMCLQLLDSSTTAGTFSHTCFLSVTFLRLGPKYRIKKNCFTIKLFYPLLKRCLNSYSDAFDLLIWNVDKYIYLFYQHQQQGLRRTKRSLQSSGRTRSGSKLASVSSEPGAAHKFKTTNHTVTVFSVRGQKYKRTQTYFRLHSTNQSLCPHRSVHGTSFMLQTHSCNMWLAGEKLGLLGRTRFSGLLAEWETVLK